MVYADGGFNAVIADRTRVCNGAEGIERRCCLVTGVWASRVAFRAPADLPKVVWLLAVCTLLAICRTVPLPYFSWGMGTMTFLATVCTGLFCVLVYKVVSGKFFVGT